MDFVFCLSSCKGFAEDGLVVALSERLLKVTSDGQRGRPCVRGPPIPRTETNLRVYHGPCFVCKLYAPPVVSSTVSSGSAAHRSPSWSTFGADLKD